MRLFVWLRAIGALLLVTGIVAGIAWRDSFSLDAIREWVGRLGLVAPLAFIAVFALCIVVLLPATAFSLAAGAVFGPGGGAICNVLGSTWGATLAFLTARWLGAAEIQRAFGPRGRSLIEGVEAEGWRFVVFVRMLVVIPFNLSNYLFGITRIRVGPYALATALGMVPGSLVFSYLGHAIGETLAHGEGPVGPALLALALLVLVALVPRWLILRRVHVWSPEHLADVLTNTPPPVLLDLRADQLAESLTGAFHIPVADLPARVGELGPPAGRTVVLLTEHGGYPVRVLRTLRAAGFRQVAVLRRGLSAWHIMAGTINGSSPPAAESDHAPDHHR